MYSTLALEKEREIVRASCVVHVGVAKLLLEYGANINTHSNEFKESALTLACYKGHLEMVKYLLNAGRWWQVVALYTCMCTCTHVECYNVHVYVCP